MQLFLISQVKQLAAEKWGVADPYEVSLTLFNKQQLLWLLDDPNRFKQLSPERFQYFLADRLDAMGLCVQMMGHVNRPDGGIDILAYPDPASCAFPFLIAVQAAHHRTDRKTTSPKVREFVGAYAGTDSPFRVGLIATNTAFTWDAENYAKSREHLLRLRDIQDLVRWLRGDFVNEAEWREIPVEIELAGYRIPILNPRGKSEETP